MPGTSLTCPGHEMANETRRAGRGDAIVVQHTAHMHTQTVAQADWRHSGKLADAGCVHDNRQRWIRRIIKFTSCLPRSSWLGSDSFLSLSLPYVHFLCVPLHTLEIDKKKPGDNDDNTDNRLWRHTRRTLNMRLLRAIQMNNEAIGSSRKPPRAKTEIETATAVCCGDRPT